MKKLKHARRKSANKRTPKKRSKRQRGKRAVSRVFTRTTTSKRTRSKPAPVIPQPADGGLPTAAPEKSGADGGLSASDSHAVGQEPPILKANSDGPDPKSEIRVYDKDVRNIRGLGKRQPLGRERDSFLGVEANAYLLDDSDEWPGESSLELKQRLQKAAAAPPPCLTTGVPGAAATANLEAKLEFGRWFDEQLKAGKDFCKLVRAGKSPEDLRSRFPVFFQEVIGVLHPDTRDKFFDAAKRRNMLQDDLADFIGAVKDLSGSRCLDLRQGYLKYRKHSPPS